MNYWTLNSGNTTKNVLPIPGVKPTDLLEVMKKGVTVFETLTGETYIVFDDVTVDDLEVHTIGGVDQKYGPPIEGYETPPLPFASSGLESLLASMTPLEVNMDDLPREIREALGVDVPHPPSADAFKDGDKTDASMVERIRGVLTKGGRETVIKVVNAGTNTMGGVETFALLSVPCGCLERHSVPGDDLTSASYLGRKLVEYEDANSTVEPSS